MRFTIRDLLWLTVVVALAVGWWADRRSLIQANWKMAGMLAAEQGWHRRAEYLADVLRGEGWTVELTVDSSNSQPPNPSAPAPKTPKESANGSNGITTRRRKSFLAVTLAR